MNFGEALVILKEGGKVQRDGWNGKGMWLLLVPADKWSCHVGRGAEFWRRSTPAPWIGMKTATDQFVPWVASHTDLLAEDWDTWTTSP